MRWRRAALRGGRKPSKKKRSVGRPDTASALSTADGPGCGDRVQKLYMSTSNDGLTWAKPQKISGSDLRRLDPTGYEISTNVFRVYYATATAGVMGDVTYTIKRGTIAIKQSSSEVSTTGKAPTTTPKKTTITCVKGKTTKKVTGVNPKCPSGYKKK